LTKNTGRTLPLAEDLLVGVPRIAAYMGMTEAETYYHIRQKRFPTKKLGKQHIARKSQLDALLTPEAPGGPPPERASAT
jgi:hypothetical protein